MRFLAVDGSDVSLPVEFVGLGCPKSTNGHYATAKISGLYDVNMKIPINFYLFTHGNERKALLEQIKLFVRPGDVIICDRGYYSSPSGIAKAMRASSLILYF